MPKKRFALAANLARPPLKLNADLQFGHLSLVCLCLSRSLHTVADLCSEYEVTAFEGLACDQLTWVNHFSTSSKNAIPHSHTVANSVWVLIFGDLWLRIFTRSELSLHYSDECKACRNVNNQHPKAILYSLALPISGYSLLIIVLCNLCCLMNPFSKQPQSLAPCVL